MIKAFQTLDKTAVGLSNVANIGVSTLGGINLTYNTTSNKLDVDTTLTSMSKISSSSGNFEIGSENEIKFYSDENGNNGGGDFIWVTSKTSGGMSQQLMKITGSTGNVVMNGESLTLNNLNVDVNAIITGDLTVNGDLFGEIHPYITTSQADYDQPIVCYQASGFVPTPPAQLSLIVPKTNIITVNSSTGLFKSKSIDVNGSITNATNITSTTAMTTATMYATNINTSTLNAAAVIDCERITGGRNNGSQNFHIDNYTTTGEIFLNYYRNNNIRCFNPSNIIQRDGGIFTIFSNKDFPCVIHNNYNTTLANGFNSGIKQESVFNSYVLHSGLYKATNITTVGVIGYTTQSGSIQPCFINSYQGGSLDWTTNFGRRYAPVGGPVIMSTLFVGTQAQLSLTTGYDSLPKITVGRSTNQDYGIHFGGWNGGVTISSNHIIQASSNLHLDASNAGDIYMNLYGQAAPYNRKCRVYGFVDGSDRRIKTNFISIDDDKLLNEIEQLELTTYNFKDPRFKSKRNTLGFIADSLEGQTYFENFMEISNYNMPFDDQIELNYTINQSPCALPLRDRGGPAGKVGGLTS